MSRAGWKKPPRLQLTARAEPGKNIAGGGGVGYTPRRMNHLYYGDNFQVLRDSFSENDGMAYLTMMANRLRTLHRFLKPSDSLEKL